MHSIRKITGIVYINNNIITMTSAMYAKTSHIKNGKIFKKCVRA